MGIAAEQMQVSFGESATCAIRDATIVPPNFQTQPDDPFARRQIGWLSLIAAIDRGALR